MGERRASGGSGPERLIWRGLGGVVASLLAETVLVFLVLRRVRQRADVNFWMVAETGLGLLTFAGLAVFAWAILLLGKGFREEWWTEEEMEPVRRRFGHWGWTTAMFALALFYVAGNFFAPRRSFLSAVGVLTMLPAMTIPPLLGVLRRRREDTVSRVMWEQISPIRSEHWGER